MASAFKTVDELAAHCKHTLFHDGLNSDKFIHFMVYDCYLALKDILMSDTNVPSEHDLSIISTINHMHISDKIHHFHQILDIYKNRKVL